MARWIALKARADCPECGLPVMIDGPWSNMRCPSCHADSPIGYYWGTIVSAAVDSAPKGRRFAPKYVMDTTKPVPGIHSAINRDQPPICSSCDAPLAGVDAIENGTDGTLTCPACGAVHDTFPAPRHVQNGAVQVFLAVRENEQSAASAKQAAKPVMFSCTNCGGNLRITSETTRIVTCQYCDCDLFLPQALWNAIHPVRRRRAFWVRMR